MHNLSLTSRGVFSAIVVLLTVNVAAALGPKIKAPELPKDEATGKITWQDVIEVPGVSSDELFSRATAWVATAYKSANDVIQMSDRAGGKLIVKGLESHTFGGLAPFTYYVRHSVTIEVKDGRYRYTISDFRVDDTPLEIADFRPRKRVPQLMWRTKESMELFIPALTEAMNQASPAGSDDW